MHAQPSAWATKRRLAAALAAVLVVAATGLAASWHFSNKLRDDGLADNRDRQPDAQVVSLDGDQITLTPATQSRAALVAQDELLSLTWDGSYAQVGAIRGRQGQAVTRQLFPIKGLPKAGDRVRLDDGASPADQAAAGLPFEDVTYTAAGGSYPAWLVRGSSLTWVIFVHGKGAGPEEGFRILPTLVDLNLTTLLINYRNDISAPPPPDNLHHFGATEWVEVEGATQYALNHGAERVILIGYSMGGSIVMSFLYHSPLADRVDGVILDSPALDFAQTVRYQARLMGIPDPITNLAQAIAGARFGIDWQAVNYLASADRLRTPILLFQGDADQDIPPYTSEALAAARPDLVRYVRTPGAKHVESWNTNPQRYEAAVTEFIQTLIPLIPLIPIERGR